MIAIGSDEKTHFTNEIIDYLSIRNQLKLFGSLNQDNILWPAVAKAVAESVSKGESKQGIIFCWTGTGVSIAANKIPGIRAALCVDAETARGARKWNNANVLVMSLRLTTITVAKEILSSWFETAFSLDENESIKLLSEIENKYLIEI